MKKQVTILGGLAVLAAINMVPAMADDAPSEAYTPAAVATEEPAAAVSPAAVVQPAAEPEAPVLATEQDPVGLFPTPGLTPTPGDATPADPAIDPTPAPADRQLTPLQRLRPRRLPWLIPILLLLSLPSPHQLKPLFRQPR